MKILKNLTTKIFGDAKDPLIRARRILIYFEHPFIIGLLGFLMVSYFLKNTTDLWFYSAFFFYLLMLPKILTEFFLLRENATEDRNKFIFKIILYYLTLSLLTDTLFYKINIPFISIIKLIVFYIFCGLGFYYYKKKQKTEVDRTSTE